MRNLSDRISKAEPAAAVTALRSVAAEHERLERQQQRLDPKEQRVYEAERIDGVKSDAAQRARILGNNNVVIVGIRVGDATASRSHTLESTLIERFKKCEQSSWL